MQAPNIHRGLLDQLGLASFGFEEAPMTWLTTMPATFQNENIAISA